MPQELGKIQQRILICHSTQNTTIRLALASFGPFPRNSNVSCAYLHLHRLVCARPDGEIQFYPMHLCPDNGGSRLSMISRTFVFHRRRIDKLTNCHSVQFASTTVMLGLAPRAICICIRLTASSLVRRTFQISLERNPIFSGPRLDRPSNRASEYRCGAGFRHESAHSTSLLRATCSRPATFTAILQ